MPGSAGIDAPGTTAMASADTIGIILCEPSSPLRLAVNRPRSTFRRTGTNSVRSGLREHVMASSAVTRADRNKKLADAA